MTLPLDIHTHLQPEIPGTAILNVQPNTFHPRSGEYYSIGIHPWSLPGDASKPPTKANHNVLSDASLSSSIGLLSRHATHPQVIAIGETGIDKLSSAPLSLQMKIFRLHAELASSLRKPLIIHLVKATDELLALKRELRPSVPWIIHGFRGKATAAAQYIHHGIYLSFGMKHQEETIRSIPTERLLLETDDSHLPISSLYQRVASLRGVFVEELHRNILANIGNIFFSEAEHTRAQ